MLFFLHTVHLKYFCGYDIPHVGNFTEDESYAIGIPDLGYSYMLKIDSY
jgi:hypothetical protein